MGDGRGSEWLVYDPELVEFMRAGCPICNEGGEHS